MNSLTLAATAALALGAITPEAHADGRKAGSVLVFPVHRSGTWTEVVIDPFLGPQLATNTLFTILCVTNTETTPSTQISLGGSTNLHYEYINVQPGTAWSMPAGCTIFDRVEYLTPADTLCVLTSCHNAVAPGLDNAREGYVVVSAENPSMAPGASWDHDWLIGSEMVLSASGVAFQINAVALQGQQGPGNSTTHPSGELRFNGIQYQMLPDVLMTDYIAVTNARLTLINFTGGPTVNNHVSISIYNDNEYPLSAHFPFKCWFNEPLSTVAPLFSETFLQSTPHDPYELLLNCNLANPVTLETGWMSIQSTGLTLPGGGPLAPLGPTFQGGCDAEVCEEEPNLNDGALLGSITASDSGSIGGGHLLWESGTQGNGAFRVN